MLTQRLEDIMDRWIGAGCITSPEVLSERITEAKRKESQLLGITTNHAVQEGPIREPGRHAQG
jgi:hypothetical protein